MAALELLAGSCKIAARHYVVHDRKLYCTTPWCMQYSTWLASTALPLVHGAWKAACRSNFRVLAKVVQLL